MEEQPAHRLASLVQYWLRKVEKSRETKKVFHETGEMCRQFFSGTVGFMWEDSFRAKYLKSVTPPRFRVTIAKAFELVAIFGPSLFWRFPGREVKSREVFVPDMEGMGDPESPEFQEMMQQINSQITSEKTQRKNRDKLMQLYLNYSQREQPGGGLKADGQYAVTEALVKGRGVTWCEAYTFPGSDTVLTGNFFDTVDNLFIDADARRPNLSDAHWIARRHRDPYWKVERRFGLKPGTLKDKSKFRSADHISRGEANNTSNAVKSQSSDLVEWYEIFSKCGVGTREKGIMPEYHSGFEEVVGDFAYICVCDGVDYPLNLQKEKFEVATDEEVLEALDWPIPFYKDGRWPCAILDFYPNPNSVWPLAPMAMGLGELIFLNTMMSVLCERAYENSRLLVAAMKGASSEVVAKIKNGSMKEVIEVNPEAQRSVSDLVSVIQMPEIGFDLFRMINMVSAMFDKRTGLSELLYGANPGGVQSRTAADINVKSEMASIRPEYMSQQVEEWQTEVANLERIAAGWSVSGESLVPLLGTVGAQMWDELIVSEDPETFVREMRCTVEANSIKKPNKSRDNENINRISQFLMPELSKHADITGDTGPLNNFIEDIGLAIDQDTSRWTIPDRSPPEPDPEAQEMQKQLAMAELASKQAAVKKLAAEASGKDMANAKMLYDMESGESQGEDFETELQMRAAEMDMELASVQAQTDMDLQASAMERQMELDYQRQVNQLKADAESAA